MEGSIKQKRLAQLAGAVEYTDCISVEGNPPSNKCSVYEIKQSDGETQVMLEIWAMESTLSLSSLPVPLWPGVVAPDKVLSMGQIELNCVIAPKLNCLTITVFTFNSV